MDGSFSKLNCQLLPVPKLHKNVWVSQIRTLHLRPSDKDNIMLIFVHLPSYLSFTSIKTQHNIDHLILSWVLSCWNCVFHRKLHVLSISFNASSGRLRQCRLYAKTVTYSNNNKNKIKGSTYFFSSWTTATMSMVLKRLFIFAFLQWKSTTFCYVTTGNWIVF